MSNELLPCPFCFSKEIKYHCYDNDAFYQCQNCSCCGPTEYLDKRTINWNKREPRIDEIREKTKDVTKKIIS